MASDIVLSSALRNNLLSLQNTQSLIDKTQLRLATGLKVNSALDNPQNFFTSQALKNRASDLTTLLDGLSLSVQSIQEANQGVTSLTNLVQQAQSIAENAQSAANAAAGFASVKSSVDLRSLGVLQDGSSITNGASDQFSVRFYDPSKTVPTNVNLNITIGATDTVDTLVADINSSATVNPYITASVNSGGELQIVSKVDGGILRIASGAANSVTSAGFARLGLSSLVGTEQANAVVGTTRQGGTSVAGHTLTSTAPPTPAGAGVQTNSIFNAGATLTNAGFITPGANTLTATITVDGTANTNAISLTSTSTIQNLIDDINTDPGISSKVTASFDTTTGKISLTTADSVKQLNLKFNGGAGAAATFGFGDAQDNLSNTAAFLVSENFNFVGNSVDLSQYQSDYNKIRTQIDSLTEDANFQGVNLLGGDNLTTFFNEDRSNSLTTTGVDFSALGLGLSKANFLSSATVQTAIDQTQSALNSVRNFGTSIANDLSIIQNRQDFTKQTIAILKAGADSLTVADQNEEGANLLALQTRQQLGVTSLSLASQSQQSVLRLF